MPNEVITHVSKDHVITTEPLDSSNKEWKGGLGCLFFKLLQRNKDKILIINGDTEESETRGSILSKSIRLALILQKHGIQKGDIVTFALNIHQNAYPALIGSLFIGAIPTFIEPFQNSGEAAHLLSTVEPKLIICSKDKGKSETLSKAVESIESDVKVVILEDCVEFNQPQQAESSFILVPAEDIEDTAVILYSSGSTGMPKGICIRHSSILHINDLKFSEKVETPVVMTFDSLYWSTDLEKFISAVKNDAILVITPTLDPNKIWQRIERYKVNKIACCPYHAILLVNAGKPLDLDTDSLLSMTIIGGVFPERYRKALQKMIPTTSIISRYGTTETGALTTFSHDRPEHMELNKNKPDSVGLPTIGLTVKIVDPETGKSLGPNQQGEFRVKKRTVMKGYYNLDSSNEFDEDGFFKTGDILYYDEDYCFFYVERIKELILYQCLHVTPALIESRLMEHPAVKRAAVIGKKDEVYGELPTAFIEANKGYENLDYHELRNFVDDKVPETHKLRGGIIAVEEIPSTASNKIKRASLRKLLESEYPSI